jgi:hypothetical protein
LLDLWQLAADVADVEHLDRDGLPFRLAGAAILRSLASFSVSSDGTVAIRVLGRSGNPVELYVGRLHEPPAAAAPLDFVQNSSSVAQAELVVQPVAMAASRVDHSYRNSRG